MPLFEFKMYRKFLVLNLINHFGSISRTHLANITGYRPATIGDLIVDLLEQNLIVEKGAVSHAHGRRRMLLEINSDGICALGISISSDSITFVISTISGVVLKRAVLPFEPDVSHRQLIAEILQTSEALINGFSDRKVIGIGVCDPGRDPSILDISMDYATSYRHFNDWITVDLRDALERSLALPVKISQVDVVLPIAEHKFGAAQDVKDFLCLQMVNGYGLSVMSGENVLTGASNLAGQIGHTVVHDSNRICFCGKTGCVEVDASFLAIRADILAALDGGTASILNSFYDRKHAKHSLKARDIRHALDADDRMCQSVVRRAAGRLGVALGNAINIFNPECVVLSGFMLELGNFFLDALRQSTLENTLPVLGNVEFRISTLTDNALPLGATAILFDDFLHVSDFKWIYQYSPAMQETELCDELEPLFQ